MKKWFLAKSLADRIAMILIAAIVIAGGTTAAVIATKPSASASVATVTTVSEDSTPLVDSADETKSEEVLEEKTEKEEVLGVTKEETSKEEPVEEEIPFVKKGYDLINGNFADGLNGFEFYAASSEYASYELNGNGIDININDTGSEDWHVQLKQNDVRLESGKWYRLSLDAKSTLNRSVTMTMQKNGMLDDDWTPYCSQEVLKLNGGWQHYQIIFKMDKSTDKNAVFNVSLGTVNGNKITKAHTVSINNINLEKLPDNYTDSLKTNGNLVGNGDFSSKSILWETVLVAPGQADVSFENNKAVFDIKNPGSVDWNVQLKQAGINLDVNNGYKVTFNATSTETRMIKVGVMDKNYVTWYGGGDIHLAAGVTTPVCVELYNDKNSNNDAILMISLGLIDGVPTPASTVTISDVKFVKDSNVYLPQGGNGSTAASAPSLPNGWTAYDHEGTHTASISAVDGGAKFQISNTGTEEWHVQYTKKPIELKKGTTYKVEYDVVSTLDRSVKCLIQHNGGSWDTYYYDEISLTANEPKHISKSFKMTKDDSDCVFNFSLGTPAGGTITTPHDITITNVSYSVEKVDLDNGNNPGIFDNVTYVVSDEDKNKDGIWDLELSKVVDYSDYVGKKVRFICTISSDADFKAQVTGLTTENWTWVNPTPENYVEFTNGTGGTKKFECVIDDFKKPVVQILARDEENLQDIVVGGIKFFEEPDCVAQLDADDPGFDDTYDHNKHKWEIAIDPDTFGFDALAGKKVKATYVLYSDAAYSGEVVIQSHADYSGWNPVSYTGEAGKEVTVVVVADDFKKTMVRINSRDEENAKPIKVKSLNLEVVEEEENLDYVAKLAADDPGFNDQYDENKHKWEIPIDASKNNFASLVGKKVKATYVLYSDADFTGDAVIQSHADYSGWNPAPIDGKAGKEITVSVVADDFIKTMVRIYSKGDKDIFVKSVTLEVIEEIETPKPEEPKPEEPKPEEPKPEEPKPEVTKPSVTLVADAPKNNQKNESGEFTNWDVDLSAVQYGEYVGSKVKFTATVSSDSKFVGCITGLSGESYAWNDPTDDQKFEVNPGDSKTVECVIDNFKKPVIQIWWKDEEHPADVVISDITFEKVE